MRYPFVVLLVLMSTLLGCTRMRFVIDAIPAEEGLVETEVMGDDEQRFFSSPSKVALIDVSGVIVDARIRGFLSEDENPVARFAEALRRAEKDSAVKAIIVRINSPGGAVTASDVMYRELKRFKMQARKPAVILMGEVAASGGFYLACAGDEVIAHRTTVTGSICVIMQTFNFSEGMSRIGIRADAITSGPNKKMGTPFEPMPKEHRDLLQGIVNEFYVNFLAVVKERRPDLKETELEWITDGRIVTGARAAEFGIIDGLGDLHDAFEVAKRRAGLRNASLVKYHRPLEHVGSAYARAPAGSAQLNMLQLNVDATPLGEQAGFYYLWDPAVC